MKKLTKAFNDVTLTRSEVFQIELPAMASAGYTWDVKAENGNVELLTERSHNPDNSGAIGGSIKQIFTFKAARIGDCEITATYKRPWEDHHAEQRSFKIKITKS